MKYKIKKESRPKVYILHENREWIHPLIESLNRLQTPYEEWFLDTGIIDISKIPPSGVFYNRMSASSHTRDNRFAVELTGPVLGWLKAHDRKVINGRRALQLEVRKIEQYISLQEMGIRTPMTIAAVGESQIIAAAKQLKSRPFILKPNRGGKGLGVRLFHSVESLKQFLELTKWSEISLDGVSLIQEYIKPKNNRITRLEFVDSKFLYALSIDTTGGFELCPADNCQIENLACPASPTSSPHKFKVLKDFRVPEISACEAFLTENNIEIAGIEFVESEAGHRYYYDVNTNTNYNRDAEIKEGSGVFGMHRVAEFLSDELQKEMNHFIKNKSARKARA